MEENILLQALKIMGVTGGTFSIVYITTSIRSGIFKHLRLSHRNDSTLRIDSLPPIVREHPSNRQVKNYRKGLWKYVDDFTRWLDCFPNVDKTEFQENISEVVMVVGYKKKHPKGGYLIDENELIVNENAEKERLIYSLLKMASSHKRGNLYAEGFRRYQKSDEGKIACDIGLSLSDAYTSILFNRFYDGSELDNRENIAISAALAIEKLVGRHNMETMYFNGALDQLIEKLSEYAPKTEIISLLKKLDMVESIDLNSKNLALKLMSLTTYKEIILLLSNMIIKNIESLEDPKECTNLLKELSRCTDTTYRSTPFTFTLSMREKTKIANNLERDTKKNPNRPW